MKKLLATLLVLVMSMCTLAACGKDDATKDLAKETLEPAVELVKTEGDVTDLGLLPVEEYVTLGDYKSIEVSIAPIKELTEDEFAEYLQGCFYQDAAAIAKDAFPKGDAVAEGDVVLIDYSGKKDGVAFEGGTAEKQTLGIGSGQFIDGFEEGLVGVKSGETVDLELTFPEDYGKEDLAGQAVVFTVTVHGIASMNDETIAAMGHEGYETVEDYRKAIEYFAAYEQSSNYTSALSDAINQKLLEICTVSKLPKPLYEKEKELIVNELQYYATMYGLDGDTYAQYISGMNLLDYAAFMTEAYLVRGVILQAIANAEGIAPTDADVDAYVEEYLASVETSGGFETIEAFYEANPKEDVKLVLLQENVMGFLAETITIKDAK